MYTYGRDTKINLTLYRLDGEIQRENEEEEEEEEERVSFDDPLIDQSASFATSVHREKKKREKRRGRRKREREREEEENKRRIKRRKFAESAATPLFVKAQFAGSRGCGSSSK